jgi:membrane-bound lytic murein transglycosylase D
MERFIKSLWLLPVVALLLSACSSTSSLKHGKNADYRPQAPIQPVQPQAKIYRPPTYSGQFQKAAELEPAVEFWRKTYAVWSRSQVAIHDDRYMNVIYEVMVLPGIVGEGLTPEQKESMGQRRDFWKAQLAGLQQKLRYNVPLNLQDKQLLAKLEMSGESVQNIINGADSRVRAQRGTRERFKRGLEISGRYDLQFRKIFRDAGLPEDLAYLPHVESSFQPAARSSAGAVGMWQFTPAAAETFMPTGNKPDQRLDPFASANGAARYLSYAYAKLRDWPTAITSYNHGIGGMKRAQTQAGPDFAQIVVNYSGPAFGFASRNYYAQFLAAREIASNPIPYFPEGVQYDAPGPAHYAATERR